MLCLCCTYAKRGWVVPPTHRPRHARDVRVALKMIRDSQKRWIIIHSFLRFQYIYQTINTLQFCFFFTRWRTCIFSSSTAKQIAHAINSSRSVIKVEAAVLYALVYCCRHHLAEVLHCICFSILNIYLASAS